MRGPDASAQALGQNGHCPAVFLIAALRAANFNRPLLAVAAGLEPQARNAARDKVFLHRLRPPEAQREVVFARATLIRMAFENDDIAGVAEKPFRLDI